MSQKYTIKQGDTFITVLTITDQDDAAVNLTSGTVTMTIQDRTGADLHEEVVTSHTTPASGITTVTISKDDTASFPIGCYDYDIQIDLSDGTRHTLTGQFEVADDIT